MIATITAQSFAAHLQRVSDEGLAKARVEFDRMVAEFNARTEQEHQDRQDALADRIGAEDAAA
jgi:hypothetical protein